MSHPGAEVASEVVQTCLVLRLHRPTAACTGDIHRADAAHRGTLVILHTCADTSELLVAAPGGSLSGPRDGRNGRQLQNGPGSLCMDTLIWSGGSWWARAVVVVAGAAVNVNARFTCHIHKDLVVIMTTPDRALPAPWRAYAPIHSLRTD